MKKLAVIVFGVLFVLTLTHCRTEPVRTAEEYFILCDSLLKINQPDQAIAMLEEVRKYYATDTSLVIRSLDMTADIYASVKNQYTASAEQLEQIIDQYPKAPEMPKALFKLGFTYENMIKDMEKARQYYEQFLKLFPDHELAQSVRISLEFLGETEDQMLDRLLKKSSDSAMSGKTQ